MNPDRWVPELTGLATAPAAGNADGIVEGRKPDGRGEVRANGFSRS